MSYQYILTAENWMLGVSEDYIKEWGNKKRQDQIEKGAKSPVAANYWYNKRKRYLKYIEWRDELKRECNRVLYFPQTSGYWLKFFIPMPKSWSIKKKNKFRFEPCLKKEDTSNFVKAYEDALFKDDSVIWDFRASKFWADIGYIEVSIGELPIAKGYSPIPVVRKNDELR